MPSEVLGLSVKQPLFADMLRKAINISIDKWKQYTGYDQWLKKKDTY